MQIIKANNFYNYVKTQTKKRMIVIHGTYSGRGDTTIDWLNGPAGKTLAVHYVIDEYGKIFKLFDNKYFAYHAGADFRKISQDSVGIQIVNWLNLTKKNGKYYTWTKKQISPQEVIITQKWRNNRYWQKIKQNQFNSLSFLLSQLCNEFNIRKRFYRQYNPKEYTKGDFSGILMHSSFHPTRLDFQPTVIPKILL